MADRSLEKTLNLESHQEMSGAEIVLQALIDQGVEVIFGYPGGAVLPVYDALFKQNTLRHILVRHEQGAVHAAEGYARATGKVGCVLVTSGPGATNAVTGLTDAMMDSVPIVCLTGQVPTHMIGTDAFQECDTSGVTRPCTKHNYLVKDVNDLSRVVHEAFNVARTGRPGPVVVDLPKDVQFATAPYERFTDILPRAYAPVLRAEDETIKTVVEALETARKPIFYTGGGVINSGDHAAGLLTDLVHKTNFPCTNTLMGLGGLPASSPNFLGMLGMHGTYEANLSMYHCDLMICVGARFDDRVTGKVSEFSPGSRKIHIDIDPSSINKNIQVDIPVVGDCGTVLGQILSLWESRGCKTNKKAVGDWWQTIDSWRAKQSLAFHQSKKSDALIRPQHAIKHLADRLARQKKDFYITTEVGQHQMWAAQYIPFEEPRRWMTSGGLGTMGYGLPAAVGVQIAYPDAAVIDVSGEASFLMNVQELGTAVQHRLPIKVFIINNQWMGMVRQWQQLLHGERYSQSYSDSLPDFVALAKAFGACGLRAHNYGELDSLITAMLEEPGPVVADIQVVRDENCFPMIPSGRAHNEMMLSMGDHEKKQTREGRIMV
ncbi:MAG: acetolactate synthase 3 large subunit [Pseudomonadota bacterium]